MNNFIKLKSIAQIYSGGTPSRENLEYWNGEIPWVKTGQIQNNLIKPNDVDEYVTQLGLKKSSAKIAPKGTILMAMYGQGKTRGQVGILDMDASINQACCAIEPKSNVSKDFLFQYLLFCYKEIRKISNDGGQKNLSSSLIKNLKIPLPPLPEQKAIADILEKWDEAIEKTSKLIEAKKNKFRWFRNNVLTGRVRVGNYKLPWDLKLVKNILSEHGMTSTGKEEVHSVSVHKGVINQIEHLGRSFSAKNTDHYNLVKPGDIIYTKSPTGDFPYGIIKQNKLQEEVIVSPLYAIFTPKTHELGAILDAYFESSINTSNYLKPVIQKGAKNTISCNNDQFLSRKLFLPTDEKEERFLVKYINTAKKEITLLEGMLAKYKNQKKGLMQKLLTGKLRISNKKEFK
ncbi:restriction endonuclease subunit S [Rickettsiales bacterium]|nr:restriction endonuclease subunit S [Rickettsiales bacterium]